MRERSSCIGWLGDGWEEFFRSVGGACLGELALQLAGSMKASQQPVLQRISLVERGADIGDFFGTHASA